MTRGLVVGVLIAAVALVAAAVVGISRRLPTSSPSPTMASAMELTSPSFTQGGPIPAAYTCDGRNVNPPLSIRGVPSGTQSLVLIVDDPDAPRGDWVHWTVWNIPSGTAEIAEGSVPASATEGMTDFGKPGYGGPCPPSGTHRYQFKLYALSTTLALTPDATKIALEQAMEGSILGQTTLVGRYARK